MMLNDGGLFYRPGLNSHHVVPKNENKRAIFAASFWMGGMVDGQLRTSGTRYVQRHFRPGPVPPTRGRTAPVDSLACAPYDRIYSLTEEDIRALNARGELTDNVLEWPWELGAGVVDGDGVPGNYNPLGGDRPALSGQQTLWWHMNDAAGERPTEINGFPVQSGIPLGVELRVRAVLYRTSGDIGATPLIEVEVHATEPVRDAHFGVWVDADLGNFDDDYQASDSLLHLGYFYNADEADEGAEGYGNRPPAVGLVFMEGPVADADGRDNDRDGQVDEPGEQLGMSSFVCSPKTSGEPQKPEEYWANLTGLQKDGTAQREGGSFYDFDRGGPPTRFCYSGDPTQRGFWTMENYDGNGTSMPPADMRFLANMGPFDLEPGEPVTIAFAFPFSRGDSRLDSVRRLKSLAGQLRASGPGLLDPTVHVGEGEYIPPDTEPPPGFSTPFPNPADAQTVFQLSVPVTSQVSLEVFDILGRSVAVLMDGETRPGPYRLTLDTVDLPTGVYLARFRLNHLQFTRRLVVAH